MKNTFDKHNGHTPLSDSMVVKSFTDFYCGHTGTNGNERSGSPIKIPKLETI